MTSNSKDAIAEANSKYFRALAHSRGSLEMLPGLSCVVGILLAVVNVGPLQMGTGLGYPAYRFLSTFAAANMVIICACVVTLALSIFKAFVYRFQAFFSSVMVILAILLVYSLCLLALPIATLTQARGEQVYADLFTAAGLLTTLFAAVATALHVVLLRRRLRGGHSEKRTLGNYLAASWSNRSTTYWITFGVVAAVPNVLTQGRYLASFVGAAMLILFLCFTTSLPVELAHLAYLKAKDRTYWEELPHRISKRRNGQG